MFVGTNSWGDILQGLNLDKTAPGKYYCVVHYLFLEFKGTMTSNFRQLSTSWSQS